MKQYNAKLLLLGEHIVLKGAQALAMPLPLYGGYWKYATNSSEIVYSLVEFVAYLTRLKEQGKLIADLDLKAFKEAIAQGLYFKSDIPIGYGLGSSGALCAAVFDNFRMDKEREWTLMELKEIFAQLEHFFHGSSSGTDPLITYVDSPILISPKVGIEKVTLPKTNVQGKFTVFLLDTGISRETEPLVSTFLTSCKEENYLQRCKRELLPFTNDAIAAFLQAEWNVFYTLIHEISYFQFKYLPALLPINFRIAWINGLSRDLYKLKLCGAGGGGFILGVTYDFAKTQEALHEHPLQVIYQF